MTRYVYHSVVSDEAWSGPLLDLDERRGASTRVRLAQGTERAALSRVDMSRVVPAAMERDLSIDESVRLKAEVGTCHRR